MLKQLSWQAISVLTSMTWVQVPGQNNFHIIFSFEFPCSITLKTHHTLQHQLIHVSQEVYQRVQNKGIGWMQVSRRTPEWKSQPIQAKMGQAFSNLHLQFWGPHPPGSIFFFFFLIFFIFYYF